MATVMTPPASDLLTYEAYMAEPQVEGRYDIVEGVRVFMPGASWDHQTISGNLNDVLRHYSRSSGLGKVIYAPFDVLIRPTPRLQTRQPDLLFVSYARLAQAGGTPRIGPLPVAPELVVEIISDSETQRILGDKITDYIAIGVDECWVVRPETRTVELLQPARSGALVIRAHDETQTLTSLVFPNLSAPVVDLFIP